ncbi:hypothetical protein J1777_05905 [Comamonas denitrificans]|uniref:Uncharacterized protein n=1 Tax=Comamonas denitrificans TaxID=117506 RepID=A0A939GUT8_9BURK|nr:hypothetical protein [Comamonas denitrificans]MBO1249372.1 hypothetical protein [Comamonas denitrificans]
MTITTQDIKFFASKVMSDVPEGGGGPSAVVLQSGKSNNIFRDVREQDRAGGNLSMRQVHLGITSGNTDVAMGSNIIVSEPPSDPNVSIVLMATKDDFATRQQDIARLEAGFIAAAAYSGQLFGDHLQGMRTLNIIQRVDASIPNVGQRLALVRREGFNDESIQYISVRKIDHTVQTFEDDKGPFERRVVTLQLGQALERDYLGFDVQRTTITEANLKARTKIRNTVWGNAAKYYGVQPLLNAGVLGQYSVRVPSIYERVVPSAEAESPIVDGVPVAGAALPVGAAEDVTLTTTQTWSTTINLVLPGGCLPGSLRVVVGGTTITDKGGLLLAGGTQVGTVDYQNGICLLLTGSYTGSKAITYRPAAYLQRIPQTSEILVSAEGRSQSYTGFILPLAQPGTLAISYRAQGRWYVLQDDGSGQLRGSESGQGAGTYNPNTGGYLVTLGALPDVGSSIVLSWGVPTQETVWPAAEVPLYQDLDLALPEGASIYPGGLSITWTDGATTKTATAAADMTLTGDASGRVYVGDKRIRFLPNALPPVGTQINVQVDTAPTTTETFEHPSRDGEGKLQVQATQGGWVPGSVRVQWNTLTDVGVLEENYVASLKDPTQDARDDGAGNLLLNGEIIGTVDYTLGKVHWMPDTHILIPKPKFEPGEIVGETGGLNGVPLMQIRRMNYSGLEYKPAPSTYPNDETGWVKISYYTAASPTQHTQTVPFAPVSDLLPGIVTPIIAGSVLLRTPAGTLASDRLGGLVQYYTNGAWATAGTIDLVTGRIAWSNWERTAPTITRVACTSTAGEALSSVFVFRTAAAPLRPSSLSLQLPAPGGGVQIVTSNAQGQLVGQGVVGTVDFEFGLVRIAFGDMVPKAEIENEPWYNPSTEDGAGNAWRPNPQVMGSLRYAAVAYEVIPVDSEIIGVNPVRLPSDGRVPIFEVGDYAVVHTHDALPPQAVTDNQAIDLGVERLSRIVIWDADDKEILHGWARDLDAGTVQILNRDGWAQPVRIAWSIEHMALIREAQIGGQITLNRPLTHHFPAGGKSYISSALMLGDRYARVSHLFDQEAWDGVSYLDFVSGKVATATYNDTVAPVEVDNTGAITQRWALQFLTPGNVRVVGESVGVVVASHPIANDLAPINPNTGTPYFTMKKEGWGSGWAAGNLVRLNTVGAGAGFCLVRAVQPGDYTELDHRFSILARVDIDRPGIGD